MIISVKTTRLKRCRWLIEKTMGKMKDKEIIECRDKYGIKQCIMVILSNLKDLIKHRAYND